jgi:hypothetical protein
VKSEAQIQAEVMDAIGAEPDFYLLRNSVGRASYLSEDGRPYTVPYGLEVGSPDLVGFLKVPGKPFAAVVGIELKRPGEKPTRDQVKCHARWSARGALVYVVCSVEEARAALADARKAVAS